MSQKTHDLVVKVGTYYDNSGVQRAKWQNIGVVIEGPHGPYMLLKPHINLAGIPKADGYEDVMVSMFKADRGPNSHGGGYDAGPPPRRDIDDEIPF